MFFLDWDLVNLLANHGLFVSLRFLNRNIENPIVVNLARSLRALIIKTTVWTQPFRLRFGGRARRPRA